MPPSKRTLPHRTVDLIRMHKKQKPATSPPDQSAPRAGDEAEADLENDHETSKLQNNPPKPPVHSAPPIAKKPRIVTMVGLIRSQQKEKKSMISPPDQSAPRAGDEAEADLETSDETSALRQGTWKVPFPIIPPLSQNQPILTPGSSSAGELYAAAQEILRTIYNAATRREPFAIEPAAEMARQFAQATAEEDLRWTIKESFVHVEMLIQHTLGNDSEKPDLVRHGLNVAIYALKIGNALDYPPTNLKELALAGMVHDIGMTWIPEAILCKAAPLSQNEQALIKEHPVHSYEILRGLGPKWEWLAEVTLQHHEREDGSGYPKRLLGDQIHEYAKIIGICEIYEALTHERPNQKAFVPFDAIKEILQTERDRFSQTILRAFINSQSNYPVGSWVRLSTREIARVVATHKSNPLRPVLEVCYDASGRKLPQPRLIDLNKELLLRIKGSVTDPAESG